MTNSAKKDYYYNPKEFRGRSKWHESQYKQKGDSKYRIMCFLGGILVGIAMAILLSIKEPLMVNAVLKQVYHWLYQG
ncbi:hypothetical protein [Xenorhabdus innexi]|uniref:Uncharacterized protein n=1 Tax=Xenorhabdus innexi TaxID=290109 RepID=A0A1N6MSX6_9GAMM|nr:hypothetical protein [Xenorhabdus innexi]PHM30374.1 hypothetical protein Xinn_03308 [Xenorhabdus innexi]SIP71942.1 hypothetical protein XIS1_130020 [Xenorhabdus innexi]